MSKISLLLILEKIKSATAYSPIAVFREQVGMEVSLDAVFGATVSSVRRINKNDPGLVGVYCNPKKRGDKSMEDIEFELKMAEKPVPMDVTELVI